MVKHWWRIGVAASAAAAVAVVFASGVLIIDVGTSGEQATAAEPNQVGVERNVRVAPSLVAVAIGQLDEGDGDHSTVDLLASIRDGEAGGSFRFFCEEAGYYNGGVRTLSVSDGVINVTGAGGLYRPDGTRIGVQYDAQFSIETGEARIHVTGRDYEYTMTGVVDGLVTVKEPQAER